MMIKHHLSDALLWGYAAGTLPEAFSLIAATHVTLCDDCRARLAALEAIGGAVVNGGELAPLSGSALEQTLARLTPASPRPAPPRPSVLPAPLLDYIGGDLDAVRWKTLGMGVRQAILPTAKGAMARLLHIPAGRAVPDHGHRGTELTLVLSGAFNDDVDRFGPGDLEIATPDLVHTPTAEPGADCICLAATDAPLRFNSLVPRLLQPIFRI
jgi:putative transcriptional regulator